MPITVSHQPDFGMLARAGYYIGAGQDMKWREEMQQRERMQERELQYNNLANQLRQQDFQRRSAEHEQQRAEYEQQRAEHVQQMFDLESQDRADRQNREFEMRRELARMKGGQESEHDMNSYLFRSAEGALKSIRDSLSDGYTFEDSEQADYDRLMKSYNSAMASRQLTPNQKAQAAFGIIEQMPTPRRKVPTIREAMDTGLGSHTVHLTDGRESTVILGLDRDGNLRMLHAIDKDKEGSSGRESYRERSTDMSIRDRIVSEPDLYLRFRAMARSEIAASGVESPSESQLSQMTNVLINRYSQIQENRESARARPSPTAPRPSTPAPAEPSPPTSSGEREMIWDPVLRRVVPMTPGALRSFGDALEE